METTATAVPVAVRVRADRQERLARLLEGGLGWPVVDPTDVVLPPVALLADAESVAGRARHALPLVLLVDGSDDPTAAATAAATADRVTVLPWPPGTAQLRAAVVGAAVPPSAGPWCTIVAAAGGVGATTVALAVAGLRSWRHGATLAAVTGPPHVHDVRTVALGHLDSPATWAASAPVPGIDDLRVVRVDRSGPDERARTQVPVVLELGVADVAASLPDVLVARPDRAGLDALELTTARLVVVVGEGPAGRSSVRAAVGDRDVVWLRDDPRVRAACHRGRHPTDAPGSWLRPLTELVAAVGGSG